MTMLPWRTSKDEGLYMGRFNISAMTCFLYDEKFYISVNLLFLFTVNFSSISSNSSSILSFIADFTVIDIF